MAEGRALENISREGLTILPSLSSPEGSVTEQNVDIVFLHGLNGQPKDTWENQQTKFYWPAQLTKDIPEARVMVYGYNADIECALVHNKTTIKAIAGMLVSRLVNKRQGDLQHRPLILVGHSLGGLVIKRALVEIHRNRSSGLNTRDIRDQNAIYDSIAGLVFMGTPHAGSGVAKMNRVAILRAIAKASFIAAPDRLVKALEAYSDELSELTNDFEHTTIFVERDIEMCSYYELVTTPGLGREVVPLEMAQLHYGNEHFEGIPADHTHMVKFPSATDDTYETVMFRLKRMGEERQVHDPSTTYRIRQIPTNVDKAQLPMWLTTNAKGIGPAENVQVFSLTTTAALSSSLSTKTATLKFRKTPHMFHRNEMEWKFLATNTGLSDNIIFDTHFRGFTALNDVDPKDHILDCIAISGLASHPFSSWEQQNTQSTFMWLRDKLTIDLKRVRVLLYGHDSYIPESESVETFQDIAFAFLKELESVEETLNTPKHLVFIAHSLGGTVLKSALVGLANSSPVGKSTIDYVDRIFFFGVPNRGIPMQKLLPMISDKSQGERIPPTANGISEKLMKNIDKDFTGVTTYHPIRRFSFYETRKSQTANIQPSGQWERNGPLDILVDKESAGQSASDSNEIFPVHEDHINLLKFCEGDLNYEIILKDLYTLSEGLTPGADVSVSDISSARDLTGWRSTIIKLVTWHREKSEDIISVSDSTKSKTVGFTQAIVSLAQRKDMFVKEEKPLADDRLLFHQDFQRNEQHQQIKGIADSRTTTEAKENSALLLSLHIEDASRRFEEVEEAFPSTFKWIWTDANLGFDSWLRRGKELYWISGKPGSGKSTLMKLICTSSNIQSALDSRFHSLRRKQILAKFFFQNNGTYNQKSLDGLLHCLLHQILSAEPLLKEALLPIYQRSDSQRIYWDIPSLQQALKALQEQKAVNVDILLILDAVDEYDGRPEDIVNFLKTVSASSADSYTRIRVCFSSRLWEEFDQFRDMSGFRIDEHTERDLREYITKRLENNESTASLVDENPGSFSEWISTVAIKTEGMFLYLKLLMNMILDDYNSWLGSQTLHPAAKFAKLRELANTDTFPTNLDEFYKQLVERIPIDYRRESYVMLELILRHEGPIDMLDFRSMVECALASTMDESVVRVSSANGDRDSILTWMSSRTRGMIEPDPKDGLSPQFMHKSVKDFVSEAGFQWRILRPSYALSGQNGNSFLARYGLALLAASWRYRDTNFIHSNWRKYLSYTRQAEVTTGRSQKSLFDQIDDQVFAWAGAQEGSRYYDSVLSYAVTADLRLYVADNNINSSSGKSLLHFAVEATISHSNQNGHSRSRNVAFPDLSAMVADLLARGCDMNSKFEGKNPFQLLFSDCFEGFGDGKGSKITPNMLKLARVFLDREQNSNQPIEISTRWWQRRYDLQATHIVKCTPLHVASSLEMIDLLLGHGADINALDSNKNTPLDIYFGAEDSLSATGEGSFPIGSYKAATLLLSRGGYINKTDQVTLSTFLRVFESELRQEPSHATFKQLKNPPRLKSGLFGVLRSHRNKEPATSVVQSK